ncbi:MAG: SLBB domain-containing protein, partial [Armatimonadetes bacterium]|nr:SLBB domain-containing protein [Armatimonadota bacterium]
MGLLILLAAVVAAAPQGTTPTPAPGGSVQPSPTEAATTPVPPRPLAPPEEPPPPIYLPPPSLPPVREPVDAGERFRSLPRFGAAVFGLQQQLLQGLAAAQQPQPMPQPGAGQPAFTPAPVGPGGMPVTQPGVVPPGAWTPQPTTPTGTAPEGVATPTPPPPPLPTPMTGPYGGLIAPPQTTPTAAQPSALTPGGPVQPGGATRPTQPTATPSPATMAPAGAGMTARTPWTATPGAPAYWPFFAPAGTPILGGPVPPNYALGGGDVIDLQVWTQNRQQVAAQLTVTPEGFIFLPTVGRLNVSGQTVQQARELIAKAYERFYDRPDVTLAVSGQRALEVYVLGDVTQPGKYTLSGMATVFTALYAAGGPSESGTYREVRLERLGQKPQFVDLYDYLLRGERQGDVLLQNGDMLFVGPARLEIGVAGEVRRPARYELNGDTTLADALEMAGGLGPQAYAPAIEVWRTGDRKGWQLVNLDAGDKSSLTLRDGDLIVVKPLLDVTQQTVIVRGAVNRPGSYAFTPGLTAGALLKLAEGPADGANLTQGLLWRLQSDMGYSAQRLSLSGAGSQANSAATALQPRDVLFVPYQEEASVTVTGEVFRPGTYPFGEGMRVRDLLTMAGGLKPTAFARRAELMRWLQPQNELGVVAVDLQAALTGDDKANIP